MPSYIDLHTHTNASDGALSPTELVNVAKNAGISHIAITDHDTADGLDEGIAAGTAQGICVIPGIELSATFPREMHILGLFIDHNHPDFAAKSALLADFRAERNIKMIESLTEQGMPITVEEVLATKDGGTLADIGRLHLAIALVNNGYADDVKDAFARHLGGNSKAYVARQKLSPSECIELIKLIGGYAFWAHPVLSETDPDALEALLIELKGYGLDGVECYHSSHDLEYTELCLNLCAKHDLMISGGSDYHGANKPSVQIGQVLDEQYIDGHLLDDIKRKIGID